MTVNAIAGAPRPIGSGASPAPRPQRPLVRWRHRRRARLPLADRRREAANRSGFSIKRKVSMASPREIKIAASASPSA